MKAQRHAASVVEPFERLPHAPASEVLRDVREQLPAEQLPRTHLVGAGMHRARSAFGGEPAAGVVQHDRTGHAARQVGRRLDDEVELPAVGVLHEDPPMPTGPPLRHRVLEEVDRLADRTQPLREPDRHRLPVVIPSGEPHVEVAQLVPGATRDRALDLQHLDPLVSGADRDEGIDQVGVARQAQPEVVEPASHAGQRRAASKTGCGAGTNGRTRWYAS
jgi:hypothetical protein